MPRATAEAELQSNIARAAVVYGWHRPVNADRRAQADAKAFGAVYDLPPLPGVYVHHGFSLGTDPGWPDVFLARVADRRLLFAELKSDTGKLSERQELVLAVLRHFVTDPPPHPLAGPRIEVFVWRPADWQSGDIDEVLR